MFRVIIAGGRDFNNYEGLKEKMDHCLSMTFDEIVVLCGQAKGADTLGEQYAKERGYKVQYYPARWNKYGKRAGYLRNQEMAENADALVAFWDGQSRGTAHMIEIAHEKGLKVRVFYYHTIPVKEVSENDCQGTDTGAGEDAAGSASG